MQQLYMKVEQFTLNNIWDIANIMLKGQSGKANRLIKLNKESRKQE